MLDCNWVPTATKAVGKFDIRVIALPSNAEVDKFSPTSRANMEEVISTLPTKQFPVCNCRILLHGGKEKGDTAFLSRTLVVSTGDREIEYSVPDPDWVATLQSKRSNLVGFALR